jgi:hypothetical protein
MCAWLQLCLLLLLLLPCHHPQPLLEVLLQLLPALLQQQLQVLYLTLQTTQLGERSLVAGLLLQ